MGWEAWLTLGLLGLVLWGLAKNWMGPDLLLVGALTVLLVVAALTGTDRLPNVQQAVAGFGNPGPLTVGVLFVVVEGLVQTGAMARFVGPMLGRPQSIRGAQARMLMPVLSLSPFLNNTPIVAMFLPVVRDLCRRTGISPSKLLIPLSYAAMLGGTCTLIGTSTNLVVHGMMLQTPGLPGLSMFEIAWVGVPLVIVGVGFLLIFSPWLLPARRPAISLSDDPRQYSVEMLVDEQGPLVGQTIEQAGLRHLPSLFLAEIQREGEVMAAVAPQARLRGGDLLVFVGAVESMVDLRKFRGLSPATEQIVKLQEPITHRRLVEAVVAAACPLVGKTIREGGFRSRYEAVVIAVARSGERLGGKIGDIVLEAGDTLLLETGSNFVKSQRYARDFYLVSQLEDSAPPRHHRAGVAIAILVGMVLLAATGILDMLVAAMLAAGAMLLTRCCTGSEARRSIDLPVLVVIAAALGMGRALEISGAAAAIAQGLVHCAGDHPWLVLVAVYFATSLFTEFITNNAAAALLFPVALASAHSIGANPMPYLIAVMIAASSSFATPLGYQTNMMVYGPGGYRFSDFLRMGLPMNVVMMVVTVVVIPWVWPLQS